MGRFAKTIYRKCVCGETAHDAHYLATPAAPGGGRWRWLCRNCRKPALNRDGTVKVMSEHDRPGSSERGPG